MHIVGLSALTIAFSHRQLDREIIVQQVSARITVYS